MRTTDDEISLLGWILSLLFGIFFLFGAGGYGHQLKWAVDRRQVERGADQAGLRALVERVVRESVPYPDVDVPAFTGPLWFAVPQDAKERGESPEWDSLTQDRTKRLAKG